MRLGGWDVGGQFIMELRVQGIERIIFRHIERTKDCDKNCIALRVSVNWERKSSRKEEGSSFWGSIDK